MPSTPHLTCSSLDFYISFSYKLHSFVYFWLIAAFNSIQFDRIWYFQNLFSKLNDYIQSVSTQNFLCHFRLLTISTMRSACLSLLLVTACWALPFRQSGFLDFMMEDEGSGDPVTESPLPPVIGGPKCPFRCQCHLRVIQCSDLGKAIHFPVVVYMVV